MWEQKLRVIHDTSGLWGAGDVTDRPCPTVVVGVNSVARHHYQVEFRRTDIMPESGNVSVDPRKPPYRIPSMEQIRDLPWNGYRVASTFSGCGGSSLGYKMAGFRVVYAAEFVPAAQDTYRANFPDTFLDPRDIRQIKPGDLLGAAGLKVGELDILDGSPPCASFSTSGKREAGWGDVKAYSDTYQRTDDLFFEYARLIRGVKPRVFVAENVSGLIKGSARGMFLEFLAELRECGYKVAARLLDAQWLGVPQQRQRLIFVGVRDDLGIEPAHPLPLRYRYSVREAIPWVRRVAGTEETHQTDPSGALPLPDEDLDSLSIAKYAIGDEWGKIEPGGQSDRFFSLVKPAPDKPAPTVTALAGTMSAAGIVHPTQRRKLSEGEVKRLCSFPDDFILTGSFEQRWERCGRAVPPMMMKHIAEAVRDHVLIPLDARRR